MYTKLAITDCVTDYGLYLIGPVTRIAGLRIAIQAVSIWNSPGMGRRLWSTGPLADEEIDVLDIRKTMFDHGQYPLAEEAKKLLAACAAASEEKQAPFSGQTCPYASSTLEDYERRLEQWFENVSSCQSGEPCPVPTIEQMHILRSVQRRVLCEVRLAKMGDDLPRNTDFEEPIRGFLHGEPGTGKSQLIAWIRSMFEDGMGWTHGVHFLFVAV